MRRYACIAHREQGDDHHHDQLRRPNHLDRGQSGHPARPQLRVGGPHLPGPPFNSNRNYAAPVGSAAAGAAFKDTWTLSDLDVAWMGLIADEQPAIYKVLETAGLAHGKPMQSCLCMMAVRLLEMRRVMKDTASIYLHCYPTASHYLKLLMDAVFGPGLYLNEMTWKRSSAHSDTRQGMRRAGRFRDVVLVYSKGPDYVWNPQYMPYDDDYLANEYRHAASDGRRYKETDVTAAKPGGDTEYEWRVKRPQGEKARWSADLSDEYREPRQGWEYRAVSPYRGRYWAYSRANLTAFWNEGRLIHRETGMRRLMHFAEDMPGIPLQDLWDDIPPVLGSERIGYPTQKPLAFLDRIIKASSNEGDVVLDPFCGCATACVAAENLGRRWIGIDITHLAITLVRHRLHDSFGDALRPYEIVGQPTDSGSAVALAEQDRYQFEWWALGLVDARPANDRRRGADGYINFFDDTSGKPKRIIAQVKSGHVNRGMIATLKGDMEREKAEVGVFISLQPPTEPMRQEALSAGIFTPEHFPDQQHPRVQILTIEELLAGAAVSYPRGGAPATFQQAPRRRRSQGQQTNLV